MAFEIPWTEPDVVTVGDRIQWKKSLSAYPATAEGWTLTYYLRSALPSGQIDITAMPIGQDYSVDIPPATSEGWTPGDYYWSSFVSKSNDRKPIESGRRMQILQNPADTTLPWDGRSYAKRCLDAIESVLENRASRDDLKYVVQAVGRSVDKIPHGDLIKLRDYFMAEVSREENSGTGKGKNVLIRFPL